MTFPFKNAPWSKRLVTQIKTQVKQEADAAGAGSERRRREFILLQIRELSTSTASEDLLRLFVFIVSALIQHAKRGGGLSPTQIKRLADMGADVLRAAGVKPRSSKLSFLHGELHLALSQIHFREGADWNSAWEQQVSAYLSGASPIGGRGFQSLAQAIRHYRLGNFGYAQQLFSQAEQDGLDDESRAFCRLNLGVLFRLKGDTETSHLAIAEAITLPMSEDLRKEYDWEQLKAGAMASGDWSALERAVRKGGSHHDYRYILEFFLYTRAVESRHWIGRYQRAIHIARDQTKDPKEHGFVNQCVITLEKCYDFKVPAFQRLKGLGVVLMRRKRLPSIDLELLVLACASRYLARTKALSLAMMPLLEYRALSLRITEGRHDDALGLVDDILARHWVAREAA